MSGVGDYSQGDQEKVETKARTSWTSTSSIQFPNERAAFFPNPKPVLQDRPFDLKDMTSIWTYVIVISSTLISSFICILCRKSH